MRIRSGFILGAGLGTRLRPLTDSWPKPLIPVFQKPLITFAMDHLISAGVQRLAVNTHHAAHAYPQVFPERFYRGVPIEFRHEDPVFETGGGIRNLTDWFWDEPFFVYNGDILSDIALDRAIEEHITRANLVTLILRSSGGPAHISWDSKTGLVTDIRNQLGRANGPGFLFTGIYIVDPAFLSEIPVGEKVSVIPIWLRLIQESKRIGAVVENENEWWDLGNRSDYLAAHEALPHTLFPAYPAEPADWNLPIHPSASIAASAQVRESIVGAGSNIGEGAKIENSILWPGATIAPGVELRRCIVRPGNMIDESHFDADL